jgi:NADPH2:quinone reductase
MRALVADRSAPSGVSLAEAPEPQPAPDEVLVEVHAVSLNRGELRRLETRPEGTIPGWDVAGVVRRTAPECPPEGARVVGLARGEGAWAELVAVDSEELVELPTAIDFEDASTLPVAGVTAIRAIEAGGPVLGRRVLVTGAAGGVGRFAIQLAHRAGAHVTAVVRNAERGDGLRELGADELITELEPDGEPFDVLLESVGGASLAAALTRVAPDGTVVSFGNSSSEATTFNVSRFYNIGAPLLYGLRVWDELDRKHTAVRDLTLLTTELAAGRLDTHIGLVASWREPEEALAALRDRRVAGKAVLRVD